MKNSFYIFLLAALMISTRISVANNISVTSVSLTGQNTGSQYTLVQFNISWENSWRTSSAPNNWDAAWVFVKYKVSGNYVSAASASSSGTTITVTSTTGLRVGMPISRTGGTGTIAYGTVVTAITDATHFTVSAAPSPALSGAAVVTGTAIWEHATLNSTGHTAPTGSTIMLASDGTGIFIYRNADGTGSNAFTNALFRWNYGVNGVADGASVDIQVFAIEMVYVPGELSFYVGDGSTSNVAGAFNDYNSSAAFQITGESVPATLGGSTSGNMRNNNASGMPIADDFNNSTTQSLPTAFPKGYNAFYCMKYEISQQQYVDFLNSLTQVQASARKYTSTLNRYAITGSAVGSYATTNLYVACNFLSWPDVAAYLDWSGLRPMTELEFEKACRGPVSSVVGEYAWGNTTIYSTAYTFSGSTAGTSSEVVSNPASGTTGNVSYFTTNYTNIAGPMRVGNFATSGSNRIVSGATYYGIMEMSGNVWERTVTVGNATGRSFTGTHGDGALDNMGLANATTWPVTDAIGGAGFRGGQWFSSNLYVRVSARYSASLVSAVVRDNTFGGRGVRLEPVVAQP